MISVIIPTLNEKKNISLVLKKLKKIKYISEIIFVDDNSSDGTFKEIKKYLIKNKIKGYLRKRNKDLSKSVIYGVSKANYENILVMDCDMQHDVNYINKMWNKFKKGKYEVVVATRFGENRFFGNLGFFRSIISKFAILLINFIFGKKTSDPLSGFFICKKKTISNYKKYFYANGYKILFDILYNGKKNLVIFDQEIIFRKRIHEKSKFNLRIMGLFFRQILYTLSLVKK